MIINSKRRLIENMKETKKYLIRSIFIPLILIIVTPLILTVVLFRTGLLKKINLDGILIFNYDIIPNIILYILVYCILGFFIFLLHKKSVSELEFLKGDLYGDISWEWYFIAYLLGYRKISLTRKPYKIIYILVSSKLFIIKENKSDDKDVIVEISTTTINAKKDDEINLVISDTYDIKMEQLPKRLWDCKTIIINRVSKDGSRKYSSNLVEKAGEIINDLKEDKKKINLFLTTNVYNTMEIFDNYFNVGHRAFVFVEIYQQDTKGLRSFYDKGYIIKKGEK